MNHLQEAVAPPDPAVKRLRHPTDLPKARELYRRGWRFGRLCSIPVVVAIGAVVWAIGGNVLGTSAAPASAFLIGLVASRWFTSRAWDFILRKRRHGGGAPAWRLLAVVIDAAVLLITAARGRVVSSVVVSIKVFR